MADYMNKNQNKFWSNCFFINLGEKCRDRQGSIKNTKELVTHLEYTMDDISADVIEKLNTFFEPPMVEMPTEVLTLLISRIFGVSDDNNNNDNDYGREPVPKKQDMSLDYEWDSVLKPTEKTNVEQLQCQVCYDNKKTIVTVPCSHCYYCDDCFKKMMLEKSLKKKCPLCMKDFINIVRINL
jgi:hypothetical protein